jgi:hypothetical protein
MTTVAVIVVAVVVVLTTWMVLLALYLGRADRHERAERDEDDVITRAPIVIEEDEDGPTLPEILRRRA